MFGSGILKGLGITLRHFLESYWEDFRGGARRYFTPEGVARRRNKAARGIFTVQYPEEKLPVPEAFRVIPFLVVSAADGGEKLRCTACGICARVCPPQCIWITRAADRATGKPVPEPAAFAIDIDRCMNCGYCAEYCPFDAIRMDHDYELASRDRTGHVYDLNKLRRPESYHAAIHPAAYARERSERAQREARRTGGG
jgi:NADH-quinone oxidoreductase subunit I